MPLGNFTAGPQQTSIRGQSIGDVLRERVGPLEASSEQVNQIIGSMPVGIAGSLMRRAMKAIPARGKIGASSARRLVRSEAKGKEIVQRIENKSKLGPGDKDELRFGRDILQDVKSAKAQTAGGEVFIDSSERFAADLRDKILALDKVNAPDTAYRSILSTGSKALLKKNETWRGRLIRTIEKEAVR